MMAREIRMCKCRRIPYQFQLFIQNLNVSQESIPATLTNIEYSCQVINNILKTTVNQTFSSQSSFEFSETQYLFPISEEICLESFTARYQDKTIKGIIKSKHQAQQEYSQNLQEGNLVSYAQLDSREDQDYIKIKLGNLPPNEQVHISLTYSQQLQTYLNKFYFVNIPIQKSSDELNVKLGQNLLKLNIQCTGRINYAETTDKKNIVKRSMIDEYNAQFDIEKIEDKHYHLRVLFSYEGMFEPQVIFGNSQIFDEDSVKQSLIPQRQSVMISFLPDFNKKVTEELDDALKASQTNGEDILSDKFEDRVSEELIDHLKSSKSEYIFLLDRSGSMKGKPLEKAIDALKLFLQSLPSDSYFNIISFGSKFAKLYQKSQKYSSQTLKFAVDKLNTYIANMGGTEILSPLCDIFSESRVKGYNKQIFILTDGAVENSQRVVKLIKKNNKTNRVHLIGFGSGVDKQLIEEGAIAGKGIHRFVKFDQDLSGIIIKMLCQTITPTLDNFNVLYDQNIFESVYPAKIPCIFKDEPFNLHLFIKPLVKLEEVEEEKKIVTLKYYDSTLKQEMIKQIKLESKDIFVCNSELRESVFKIGKQQQLTQIIEKDEILDQQIEQQAIDYQLLTKITAMICVIQKLNDEQKAVYEALPKVHYHHIENQSDFYFDNIPIYQYQQLLPTSSSSSRTKRSSAVINPPTIINAEKRKSLVLAKSIAKPTASLGGAVQLKKKETISSLSRNAPVQLLQKLPKQQQQLYTYSDGDEEQEESKQSDTIMKLENEKDNEVESKYMKLEKFIGLADSEGIWKYDEKLLQQFFNSQFSSLSTLSSGFKNIDIFMTLILICILEKLYASQKQKWILISKKSISNVKENIQSEEFTSLKQQILNLIQ